MCFFGRRRSANTHYYFLFLSERERERDEEREREKHDDDFDDDDDREEAVFVLDEKRVFCVDEEDGETEKNDEGIVVVIIIIIIIIEIIIIIVVVVGEEKEEWDEKRVSNANASDRPGGRARRRATEPLLGFSFRRGRRFEFATHGA